MHTYILIYSEIPYNYSIYNQMTPLKLKNIYIEIKILRSISEIKLKNFVFRLNHVDKYLYLNVIIMNLNYFILFHMFVNDLN